MRFPVRLFHFVHFICYFTCIYVWNPVMGMGGWGCASLCNPVMDLGWLANVAKHLPKGLPSSRCLDPVDLSAGNLSVSAGRASGALEPLQNLASSAPDGFPVLRSGGSKRWKPLRAFVKPNWSTGRLGQAKLIYGKASSSKIDPRSILLDEGPERFPALRSTGSKHREPVRGTGS